MAISNIHETLLMYTKQKSMLNEKLSTVNVNIYHLQDKLLKTNQSTTINNKNYILTIIMIILMSI